MAQPVILYIEDEDNDVLLFSMACRRAGFSGAVHTAVDGVEAIDYLAGTGSFADRSQHPLPGLVLLDLNLPRKSGFEVLEWARRQPQFTSLPIIVYTSSLAEADRHRAGQLGATDYIVKPFDVDEIADLVQRLSQRWLSPCARRE